LAKIPPETGPMECLKLPTHSYVVAPIDIASGMGAARCSDGSLCVGTIPLHAKGDVM